ncbi:MAG: putative toxin-antitoxin system toxin component, PIN family [Candidatus Riflebacteria bacterium]|nr:putative toxin-antitoxin system toxin component, PIN family [Candidatus Riflebacteria bacterium]
MKYRAVIDTNVLVSAVIKRDSVPGSIVDLAFNNIIIPLLNDKILTEYEEVLLRPKFRLASEIVKDIIDEFRCYSVFIEEEPLRINLPDPDDLVFYQILMSDRKQNEAYLVTGNIKHFPQTPYIVTPREMLNIILNDTNEI